VPDDDRAAAATRLPRPAPPARALALLLACLAAAPAAAAPSPPGDPGTDPPVYNGRLGQLEVSIPRLQADVRVDGRLDEEVWQRAAVLTGFSQYAPVDRLPAEDSTEVRVWYSDHAIYFGVRAFEPHGAVVATLADRDRLSGDDQVQILLDTFDDRRRALLFAVNPLGVQADGVYADADGPPGPLGGRGAVDLSPDFLFQSKGRLTDDGYEVEIRIPFKSIRYQRVPVQSWGINVIRVVQHSGHEQTWTPAQRGRPSFLGQSGTLVGLTDIKRGLVLDVNPVMTGHVAGGPQSPVDPAWSYGRPDPEVGGNLRWGVTPNLTVNLTANPDFSQVEADVGQVVFDPRSALFFPEKRPFFLDGSEHFDTPNPLVHTRRVASPRAAAKTTGKVGGLNLGLLTAVDDPGLSASGLDHPVFNIVRLRRDLGAQSTAGLLYTDRVEGADYNRVAAVDSRLLIADRYLFTGQVASSFTSRRGEADHWSPLFDLRLERPGRDWGFSALLEGRHPDFVTQSGFIARPGIARANLRPRRSFFPESGAVETYSVALILDGTWDYDRFLQGTEPNDMKLQTQTNVTLRGGWRGTAFTFVESFRYPAGLYANYFIERRDAAGAVTDTVPYAGTDRLSNYGGMLALNTPQFQRFSGSAQVIGGHDDNFDEWASAWILFATLNADWRPSERLRVNGRYVEQRFHRVSDGSLVRLRMIPRLRLEYQATRAVFLRYVGQYDALQVDALRDDSRTNDPILIRRADGSFRPAAAWRRSGFRSDWLFSYQPNPGTVVFAGYGSSFGNDEFFRPRELARSADGFFVKLSYLFRM
jgi:hypothetical protein